MIICKNLLSNIWQHSRKELYKLHVQSDDGNIQSCFKYVQLALNSVGAVMTGGLPSMPITELQLLPLANVDLPVYVYTFLHLRW